MQEELEIVNTLFKKAKGRQWPWIAPNQESKSQVDYMITRRKESKTRDFIVISNFKFHSDHTLISCTMRINGWRYKERGKKDALKEYDRQEYEQKMLELWEENTLDASEN